MQAWWTHANDGLRLRLAHCPAKAPARGTVLLFPGRTEYLEKYGRTAADFAARGYATLVIDWRGQGLADRLLDEPRAGHVSQFSDYQRDVAAMLTAAKDLDLPRPWHLLAHSMGGCIGLRALCEGLPVASASFTAPMWGIGLSPALAPVARVVARLGRMLGQGHRFTPTTGPKNYVVEGAFLDNTLTTDSEMWDYMRKQVQETPALEVGGPTIQWLDEALRETRALGALPAPAMPCLVFLGGNERIICPKEIQLRMETWPNGTLVEVPGKEHELLMEDLATRTEVAQRFVDHYDAAGAAAPAHLRV